MIGQGLVVMLQNHLVGRGCRVSKSGRVLTCEQPAGSMHDANSVPACMQEYDLNAAEYHTAPLDTQRTRQVLEAIQLTPTQLDSYAEVTPQTRTMHSTLLSTSCIQALVASDCAAPLKACAQHC